MYVGSLLIIVHVCHVGGHRFHAHWCRVNGMSWLNLTNTEDESFCVSQQGGSRMLLSAKDMRWKVVLNGLEKL